MDAGRKTGLNIIVEVMEMEYKTIPCEECDEELIEEKLNAIDRSILPPKDDVDEEELVFKITDGEGRIIAGCVLEIDCWKNADLDILWVDEKHRRNGLGSALIRKAEKTARERGCRMMVLGTFDFQARPLYEKHGFSLCGTIRDWPRGHENYTLMKRLDRPLKEYYPSTDFSEDFRIEPGTVEDGNFICKGLGDYNTSQAARAHKYIPLNKKLIDKDGNMIAAVFAGVGSWNNLDIDTIWVDEPYRNQGIGSKLLAEAEKEGKENGAYFSVINVFDWEAPLFSKHGYTPCVTIEDFPGEGHRTYEMEKRF